MTWKNCFIVKWLGPPFRIDSQEFYFFNCYRLTTAVQNSLKVIYYFEPNYPFVSVEVMRLINIKCILREIPG